VIKTGGRPTTLLNWVPYSTPSKPAVSLETAIKLRGANVSNNQVKKMRKMLSGDGIGMPSVEQVSEFINEKCGSLFEGLWLDLETTVRGGQKPVLCGIVTNVLAALSAWRETAANGVDHLKVGVDAGGGSLKITVQCIVSPESSNSSSSTMLIFAGECVETPHNIHSILHHPNIVDLWKVQNVYIVSDFKVLWLLSGLSHGGKHPCIYCNWHPDANGLEYQSRTTSFHSTWLDEFKYTHGSNPKNALKCFNCIRDPIVTSARKWFLLPPGLHLFLGIGNMLVNDLVNNLFDEAKREELVSYITCLPGVNRPNYWCNKVFEGPSLRIVLRHSSDVALRKLVGHSNSVLRAMVSFDNLVTSLFGVYRNDDWQTRLLDFATDINLTGRRMTVKTHVLIHHVPDFILEMDELYSSRLAKPGETN
jgi:hypothetical protein